MRKGVDKELERIKGINQRETNGQLCRRILDCDSLKVIERQFNESVTARVTMNNKAKCLWLRERQKRLRERQNDKLSLIGQRNVSTRSTADDGKCPPESQKVEEADCDNHKAPLPPPRRDRGGGRINSSEDRERIARRNKATSGNLIRKRSRSADDLSISGETMDSLKAPYFPSFPLTGAFGRLNWSAADLSDLNALLVSMGAVRDEEMAAGDTSVGIPRDDSYSRDMNVPVLRKIAASSVHRPPPHGTFVGTGGGGGGSSGSGNSLSVRLRSSFRHKRHSVGASGGATSGSGGSSNSGSGTTDVVNTWVYRRRCFLQVLNKMDRERG